MKIIFILFCWVLSSLQIQAADAPFWKDPKYLKRIEDQKYIAVKASTDETRKPNMMSIEGAARVSAPVEFVFKKCQDYESLKKVAKNFEEITYYPDKKRLFVHASALGYETQMILQLQVVDEGKTKKLAWESVEGGFKGMKGAFLFEDVEHVKTDMSLSTSYEADKIPLPKVLRGFGLEFVAQKVASKMRAYLEEEYRNSIRTKK